MGPAPWAESAALARLNGREPKNPRSADIGLGWAEVIRGVSPSIGARPWASRPQRIATSGPPRATRARMAASVISSQPFPRCDPELPGLHGEHPVEQQDALVGPRGQVTGSGPRASEVVVQLAVDVGQAARDRPHIRGHAERQANRVPGRRVGVLPHDQHADLGHGAGEGAQHVRPGRQVAAAGCQLGAQEVAHRADAIGLRRQGRRPVGRDQLGQGSAVLGRGGVSHARRLAGRRGPAHVRFLKLAK